MKCYISLNIKVISQYQFVCTRLSSAHTPTRKLVGVWALDKLVHTNRYCEITYNILIEHYLIKAMKSPIAVILCVHDSLRMENHLIT